MAEEHNKIEDLAEKVKEYVRTTSELIELRAAGKVAIIGSEIMSGLIIALIAILFVLFTSLAAGFYLSSVMGDRFSGFFMIAGFYLLIAIIVIAMRKQLLSKPTGDRIIRKIFDEK